jgi:hypothetical protein
VLYCMRARAGACMCAYWLWLAAVCALRIILRMRASHVAAANARTASTSSVSTLMPAVKRRTPAVANVNGGAAAPPAPAEALRPPDAAAAALLPPASASVPRPARSASLRAVKEEREGAEGAGQEHVSG